MDGEHASPGIVWFPNPLAAGSQMGTLSRLGDTRMIYSQLTYPNINFSVLGHFQLTTTLYISTYLCRNTKYIYMQNAVNEWLKFLAAQFLTDRSSSDAVPDLAHHTHGRRRKAASRILERRKRDAVVAVVVVRSKSELQTPATDGAAVVSDTCICGGGGGPAEGRLRKVEIGSARSNDEPSHRRERLHYYPTHPTHQHQSHLGHCIVITMSFIGSTSTSLKTSRLIQSFDVTPILNSFQRLLPSWQGTTWSRRSWSRLAGSCSPPAT